MRTASPVLPAAAVGVFRSSVLRLAGWTLEDIQRAVDAGRLWRVIRGWLAVPGADAQTIRAIRLGGRIGCVSALRLHGAWVPERSGMHVAMPRSASGRRLARVDTGAHADDGVVVHWRSKVEPVEWAATTSPLDIAVGHVIDCLALPDAVAVVDSVLRTRVLTRRSTERVVDASPSRLAQVSALLDPRAESGGETWARVQLALAGIMAVPQVHFAGIGRVDLLLSGWLAIEIDGRSIHAQRDAFDHDRERDALLAQQGVRVLRFSHRQVLHEWPFVLRTIQAALASR